MKVTMIDLRLYGYTVQEHEGGYIYCPWMPFSHETEKDLDKMIESLEKEYKEKNKGV